MAYYFFFFDYSISRLRIPRHSETILAKKRYTSIVARVLYGAPVIQKPFWPKKRYTSIVARVLYGAPVIQEPFWPKKGIPLL